MASGLIARIFGMAASAVLAASPVMAETLYVRAGKLIDTERGWSSPTDWFVSTMAA